MDLRNGRLETFPARLPEEAVPAADLSRRVVRWQGTVGTDFKALILEEYVSGQKLVLHSWGPGGKEGPARELLSGSRLVARSTLDGHHLCLRDAGPSGGPRPADEASRDWSVVTTAAGEQAGRLPYHPGTQSVSVLGRRAYCSVAGGVRVPLDGTAIQPRTLRAVDLTSGKTVWERPLAGVTVESIGP